MSLWLYDWDRHLPVAPHWTTDTYILGQQVKGAYHIRASRGYKYYELVYIYIDILSEEPPQKKTKVWDLDENQILPVAAWK